MTFKIIGSGTKIPSKKILNSYVAKKIKKKSTWIFEKTGVRKRYFVDNQKGETSSYLAYHASLKAIRMARIKKEKINYIISCNYTGDYMFPCLASKIAKMLKIDAGAFDLSANCSGFQLGLSVANGLFKSEKDLNNILVIGTAVQSNFINWNSPENSMYFGDGSGAVILKKIKNRKYGIIGHDTFTDATAYEDVKLVGGGTNLPSLNFSKKNKNNFLYDMSGIETWKQVITNQPKNIFNLLKKIDLKINLIDHFIFHQANKNLIIFLAKKIGIPLKKIIFTVGEYGNTADASVAVTLDKGIRMKKFKKNDLILLSSVGAGFIYSSTLIKWI
tara:strand:- start:170 stop:1162 length:993 start_codon:yes stop_codon:yes gene_type:complete